MAERESLRLWDTTAANNDDIDPAVNFAEGQLPGTLNNSNRAAMAAVARDFKDRNGSLTSTGSANAYALTINNTWTALATGQQVSFKANFTNTGAATITVTNGDAASLGSKAIRFISVLGDSALLAGQMVSNGHYNLRYDTAANSAAGAWILLNPSFASIGGIPREILTADRTYYVRTDGSDSNTGLANTSGGAFLTRNKAINVIQDTLDLGGFNVLISVADGTYTDAITVTGPWVGDGIVTLQGNTSTWANVLNNVTGNALTMDLGAKLTIAGMKMQATAYGIRLISGSALTFSKIDFGACAVHFSSEKAESYYSGNMTISAAATIHTHTTNHSYNNWGSGVATLSGTQNYSTFFAGFSEGSIGYYPGFTYTGGTITGQRAFIHQGATVETGDGSTYPDSFFPGSTTSIFQDASYNDRHGLILPTNGISFDIAGFSIVAGPSAFRNVNTLVMAGGTSGIQFNNAANSAARMNMTDAGAFKWGAYGAGALSSDASGNITASDERLKIIEGPYTDGLEALMRINPIRFSFKTTPDIKTVGLSAQNVETVIPEAIGSIPLTQDHLDAGVACEGDRAKNLDDRALIALLINAVKELSRKVSTLEAKEKS